MLSPTQIEARKGRLHEARTIQARFTADEKAEIEALAAHEDRTAAAWVRKIVRDYLRERKRQEAPRRVMTVP